MRVLPLCCCSEYSPPWNGLYFRAIHLVLPYCKRLLIEKCYSGPVTWNYAWRRSAYIKFSLQPFLWTCIHLWSLRLFISREVDSATQWCKFYGMQSEREKITECPCLDSFIFPASLTGSYWDFRSYTLSIYI